MSDVQSALDVPVKFVRFNPDPTEGDPRELDERIGELLDHLKQAISQPPVRDLEVAYLAYDWWESTRHVVIYWIYVVSMTENPCVWLGRTSSRD